jgi:hypothetical protein
VTWWSLPGLFEPSDFPRTTTSLFWHYSDTSNSSGFSATIPRISEVSHIDAKSFLSQQTPTQQAQIYNTTPPTNTTHTTHQHNTASVYHLPVGRFTSDLTINTAMHTPQESTDVSFHLSLSSVPQTSCLAGDTCVLLIPVFPLPSSTGMLP